MQQTIATNAAEIKKEHINKFNLEAISQVKPKPIKKCTMCKEGQHAFCSKRGCI